MEAGVLLPWEKYQLYPIRERNQKDLDRFLTNQGPSVPSVVAEEEEEEEAAEEEGTSVSNKTAGVSPVLKSGDRGFISEFYSRSRLHHIASWGAEFKDYVSLLRAECDGKFLLREALKEQPRTEEDEEAMEEVDKGPVVMHVDMDCFFVSVGLRGKAELKGESSQVLF